MQEECVKACKEATVADRIMLKAMVAHQGQFREGPEHRPYIVHPAEVVMRLKRWGYTEEANPDVLAIGWGHDLLEDTAVTEDEILRLSNATVLEGIKTLTFKPPQGIGDEEFDRLKADYIRGVAENAPLDVLAVKLADRICNSFDRLGTVTDAEKKKAKVTLEKAKDLMTRLDQLPCARAVQEDLNDLNSYIQYGMDTQSAMDIWDSDYELGIIC